MKKAILLLILCLHTVFLLGQTEKYSRIQLEADQDLIQQILVLGVNLDHARFDDTGLFVFEASSNEMELLEGNRISFQVLIDDMSRYYTERNQLPESQIDLHSGTLLSSLYPVPEGFSLGSLGGFCTYDEFLVHLDNMYSLYPNLITQKQPVSSLTSIENRPVYYVTIKNDNQPGPKPKVLYTGMIHAREPIGMQHFLYLMYYLLENYPDDPKVQYIVDHAELYFIPVVNPDGYLYNEFTDPNGGGMWRKNRRANFDGSFGVDLNRNFGYEWGYDNSGSSSDPASETYRGTHAFSEPETQILKELCEAIPFTIALNYHSYSNLLLYPWGYINAPPPDNSIFSAHARIMTKENGYIYGPSHATIYVNNGGSDDWMYGEQTTKPKIFAYTPEIGSANDGFWPPVNRIIPQCQENMHQSLMAALLSMRYAEASAIGSQITDNIENYFAFDIKRLGFQDGGQYTVFIEPLSEAVVLTGDPVVFSNLNFFESRSDSIYYQFDQSIEGGTSVHFLLGVDNGEYVHYDTVTVIFGIEEIAFSDNCSNLNNWSGDWGLSTVHYVSPPSSITDSPVGNYPLFGTRTVTTTSSIDLSNSAAAFLRFKGRWDINGRGAYVQVRISVGQAGWVNVGGQYSRPGIASAVLGEPVYNDKQFEWVDETIDLTEFVGSQVLIRFYLFSSSWGVGTADGFYFDDIEVVKVPFLSPVSADFSADPTLIMQGDAVQFTDLSTGNINTWSWELQGGLPDVSVLPNPLVVYPNPGMFDVSLVVGNQTITDTLIKSGFITVLDSILCRPEVFAGNDTIIPPWGNYHAVSALVQNYSSFYWTTSGDGTFNDDQELNTIYTPGANDITNQQVVLTLHAMPVYDICSGSSDDIVLTILDPTGIRSERAEKLNFYPNPASQEIFILLPDPNVLTRIEIMSMDGVVNISEEVRDVRTARIALNNLGKGVYLIRLISGNEIVTARLAVIR